MIGYSKLKFIITFKTQKSNTKKLSLKLSPVDDKLSIWYNTKASVKAGADDPTGEKTFHKNMDINKINAEWDLSVFGARLGYLWTSDLYGPYVMLLRRADTLRGQVGGGWAVEIETFWALWNGIEPSSECHLGPKKAEIFRAQPSPTCPSNGLPASKKLMYRSVPIRGSYVVWCTWAPMRNFNGLWSSIVASFQGPVH